MAKKKSKNQNLLRRILTWIKTNKLKSFLIIIALIFIGGFAYDRYQNWRNVRDMEELLAAFEQLESNLEAETGEDFYIEANCGSVGKFATSYACSIYLKGQDNDISTNYVDYTTGIKPFNKTSNRCMTVHTKDAAAFGSYSCTITVRNPNSNRAESIFYEYDKSPGRAF